MNITYYREYGIHPIEPLDPDDPKDYIVSFPSWEETIQALEENIPLDGNVITPEYTTSPNFPELWADSPGLIEKRIEIAKELTRRSNILLYLGTPLYIQDDSEPESYWLNAVLAIQNGEVLSKTYKQYPMFVEREVLQVRKPKTNPRTVLGYSVVLICNELRRPPADLGARQIFSPSLWPIPTKIPEDWDPAKVKIGDDDYYRELLEEAARGVFKVMHTVERIIVADQGITNFPPPFSQDVPPFNAVINR